MAKSDVTLKKVGEEMIIPGLFVIGLAGSNAGGKLIDKFMKVKNPSLSGFNVKSAAKPLIQITTGLVGALLLKDEKLKIVASGVAASGILSGVKVFLKKDILAGFGELGESFELDDINNLMQIEAYNPELPELSSGNFDTIEVEYPEANVEDYDEISDVEFL